MFTELVNEVPLAVEKDKNPFIFEIRSQNSGTLKFDSTSSTFTGAVVIGETGAAVDGGLTIESYAYGVQIQSVAGSTLQIKASSSTHYVILGSDIGQTLLRARTANLDIDSNDIGMDFSVGVDKLFVAGASGKVGIGTTSPQAKLQVSGGIQMADDTDTASASKVGTMRYRTGTEYVEVTSIELVTNGDFATDTNWTKGTGVTIASGVATWTNTANNVGLTQLITFTANAYYRCNVTVSNYSSGSFRFRYPGISSPRITANGTYSLIIQANQATNGTIYLQGETNGDANVNLSIDNVSVVEVTAEDASYADMCMQTAASTYEWVNIVRNSY